LNKTSGSENFPQTKKQRFSVPLQPPSGDDNSPDLIQQSWQQEQCKRPLQNWVRFSGQTCGTTPHMSQGLRDSTQNWPDNSKGCKTQTQGKSNSEPYLFAFT
jgi:hypothetical protein